MNVASVLTNADRINIGMFGDLAKVMIFLKKFRNLGSLYLRADPVLIN